MSVQRNLLCSFTKQNPFMKRFSSQVEKTEKPAQQGLGSPTSETPREMVKVSAAKKRMFVLAGLFKDVSKCPDQMSHSSMSRNMDRFRVRASIVLIILSACGALSSILLAKGVVEDIEEGRK